MKRNTILALVAASLCCLLEGRSNSAVAFEASRKIDPYDVCRSQGLSISEFRRCISAVYLDEAREANALADLGQALRRAGGEACESDQSHQGNPCMFNPDTERYEECQRLSAAGQCLHFSGLCRQ